MKEKWHDSHQHGRCSQSTVGFKLVADSCAGELKKRPGCGGIGHSR